MKAFSFVLISLALAIFCSMKRPDGVRLSKWVISEHSSLKVNGSTNVNRFTCEIVQYTKADTIDISHDSSNKMLLSGQLNIDVKNFDCKNILMTKQLRKTLKEDQYPTIHVRFLSLKENPVAGSKRYFIKGVVELTIAGVGKRFEIDYALARDKKILVLTGAHPILFSDFNLEPPKKLGKIIQAKDQLIVTFLLKMEAAS
ncbi:MAG: YceI family protein [Sphingobacteriales bacterium]|nr:MAG: YceI family protein [Sphingobacteriales bacterium]